jgi:hypothetical protein
MIIHHADFYPSSQRRTATGKTRKYLCPVAGTGGNFLPCLFVDLVDVLGQRKPFAAIHAAQTDRPSTEDQLHFTAAMLTLQFHFHVSSPGPIVANFVIF